MEEVEKLKMNRFKEKDSSQTMVAIINNTIRGIVKDANELGIKREDIVSLLKENGQFVLVYFK